MQACTKNNLEEELQAPVLNATKKLPVTLRQVKELGVEADGDLVR